MRWCTMNRALLAVLFLFTCARTPDAPAPATTTEKAPMQTETGPSVTFPDGYSVHIEIVANDELRAQGLMFRDRLRPDSGMLFMFPEDGEYPFWMKNTHIPLDILYFDKEYKLVSMHERVPPCRTDPCPYYASSGPAQYVLELNSGRAGKLGVKPGDKLTVTR